MTEKLNSSSSAPIDDCRRNMEQDGSDGDDERTSGQSGGEAGDVESFTDKKKTFKLVKTAPLPQQPLNRSLNGNLCPFARNTAAGQGEIITNLERDMYPIQNFLGRRKNRETRGILKEHLNFENSILTLKGDRLLRTILHST